MATWMLGMAEISLNEPLFRRIESLWQRRARLADVPTLILWGMRDRALGPSLLERWREGMPRAQVVKLEDAGHWPHEEAPDAVAAHLKAFLAGVPA
jgi:haloalkane dehalogenase